MTKQSTLTLLAAGALVASCSGGSPSSANGGAPDTPQPLAAPGGDPAEAGATTGGAANNQPSYVPHAEPGLGQNPASVGPAAPPPANAQGGQVAFTGDPNAMPFVNPVSDQGKGTGVFFDGTWTYNGGYMEQSTGAKAASLSFRQYAGDAFGTQGGIAPPHYRADVTAWVYQQSDQYPNMVGAPLGIIGFAPYFRDETHYLLAVAKPASLEVWAVDGFLPGTEWPVTNKLFSRTLATPLQVSTPVGWSVEIDTNTQTATIAANGEQLASVNHPLLANNNQRVALVSNGNYLHFQDFKLYRM